MTVPLILQILNTVLLIILEAQKAFNAMPDDLKQQHFDRLRWWEQQFDRWEKLLPADSRPAPIESAPPAPVPETVKVLGLR